MNLNHVEPWTYTGVFCVALVLIGIAVTFIYLFANVFFKPKDKKANGNRFVSAQDGPRNQKDSPHPLATFWLLLLAVMAFVLLLVALFSWLAGRRPIVNSYVPPSTTQPTPGNPVVAPPAEEKTESNDDDSAPAERTYVAPRRFVQYAQPPQALFVPVQPRRCGRRTCANRGEFANLRRDSNKAAREGRSLYGTPEKSHHGQARSGKKRSSRGDDRDPRHRHRPNQ